MQEYLILPVKDIEEKIVLLNECLVDAAKNRTPQGKTDFIKCAGKLALLQIMLRDSERITK